MLTIPADYLLFLAAFVDPSSSSSSSLDEDAASELDSASEPLPLPLSSSSLPSSDDDSASLELEAADDEDSSSPLDDSAASELSASTGRVIIENRTFSNVYFTEISVLSIYNIYYMKYPNNKSATTCACKS